MRELDGISRKEYRFSRKGAKESRRSEAQICIGCKCASQLKQQTKCPNMTYSRKEYWDKWGRTSYARKKSVTIPRKWVLCEHLLIQRFVMRNDPRFFELCRMLSCRILGCLQAHIITEKF